MSFLFILPFISGLWSHEIMPWLTVIQHKAPLLAMPFCCLAFAGLEKETPRKIVYLVLITCLISMGKTVSYYFIHLHDISQTYLQAKVLPVDMSNDHVRYAWVLVLIVAWLLHLLFSNNRQVSSTEKKGIIFYLVFSTIFIHLLASKTGIIGLYLVLGLSLIFHIRNRLVRRFAGSAILLTLISWFVLPTFRNRMKFVWWDFQHYSRGGYIEGLSDTPRIVSLQAGKEIVKNNPFWGTGFGDLWQATIEWYSQHAPYLKDYEQLLPSNQGLIYAAGSGLVGLIFFLMAVLYPLIMRGYRSNYAWISFHTLAIFGFLYEIGLETQYGIFVYAFLGCWLFIQVSKPVEKEN